MEKGNETKTVVPALRFPEFRGMEGWEEHKLKMLCEIGNGKDYKHLGVGNIPVYGSGGYMTSVDDFLYDGESVCIGRKGTIDKPMFLTGIFWSVDTLFYTHSFHNCLPQFLYLIFLLIDWYKYNEAGGIPSLSKTTIGDIKVLIPVEKDGKLNEQQKIADCLSSLDELIEATNRKIEALKEHKKGLMQRLFPKEGENVPELRFPEYQGTKEWEEKQLGNVGKIITGSTPSTKDITNYGGDKLLVSPADISSNRYISDTKIKLSNKGFLTGRYIQANSVLFVCIGSTIGKVAQNRVECITNQQINAIVPYEAYLSDFIYSILEYKGSKIAALAGKQAVPIINKTLFSSISILMPPKQAEQQKIADCLSSLDELIEVTSQKIEILKKHKRGLMQQLFPKI